MDSQHRRSLDDRTLLSCYRNAVLLGCTALVALAPGAVLGQDSGNSNTVTTLATDRSFRGSGTLDTDNDSKSIVATKTISGNGSGDRSPGYASLRLRHHVQGNPGARRRRYRAGAAIYIRRSRPTSTARTTASTTSRSAASMPYTYRDGLTLGRPFGGIREEPFAFERVEVLKGANSTTLWCFRPRRRGQLRDQAAEKRTLRRGLCHRRLASIIARPVSISATTSPRTIRFSYRITGKVKRADEEYDYSQNDENFFMGGLTWRPTADINLTVVYDHLDKNGVPGGGGHPVGTDFDEKPLLRRA